MSKFLASLLDQKAATKVSQLAPETQDHLERVGNFVIQFVLAFPEKIITANQTQAGGVPGDFKLDIFDSGWTKSYIMDSSWHGWIKIPLVDQLYQEVVKVGKDLQIQIKTIDDKFGKMELAKFLLLTILRDTNCYPVDDTIHFLQSEQQARTLMTDLQLAPGQALAESYHPFVSDLTSDDAMTYIFFYGLGAPLMGTMDDTGSGPFVVDLDISQLAVRDGFRPYGFRAHFDLQQNITAIFDYAKQQLVKPGDDQWEHAKYLCKQTTAFVITGREHLLWTHLLCSNEMTRSMETKLPPCHPIRRLLNVFTFRTNYINNSAAHSLLPFGSVFFRGSALTYDALQTLMDVGVQQSNIYEPFGDHKVSPKLQELSDQNKFPYLSDGQAYFGVVREFVRSWLSQEDETVVLDDAARAFYAQVQESTVGQAYTIPQDCTLSNMINLCSQLIFVVTAYHELVGTVNTYTQYVSGMGLRAVDGATTTDVQSFLIGLCITATTGVRTPRLMNTFEDLFGKDGAPEYEIHLWKDFLTKLQDLSNKVHQANETRRYPCLTFDPKEFECSVSV